jgi:SAM-dependent methyltransferase
MTNDMTAPVAHGSGEASPWVQRWSHLVPSGGVVLDLACGHGRHMKWFAARGHPVVGVDRSPEAIAAVSALGESVLADIENAPWPLMQGTQARRFNAVVVTNYLWRPLFPLMAQSVAPGGVLIYETFAAGNETVGKPSRPDFLLQPGELLQAFAGSVPGLRVIAYEDGFLQTPARFVQRLVATRPETATLTTHSSATSPARYPL